MEKDQKICLRPENLKGKPGECSPEQIKICHGKVKQHLCDEPAKTDKGE